MLAIQGDIPAFKMAKPLLTKQRIESVDLLKGL